MVSSIGPQASTQGRLRLLRDASRCCLLVRNRKIRFLNGAIRWAANCRFVGSQTEYRQISNRGAHFHSGSADCAPTHYTLLANASKDCGPTFYTLPQPHQSQRQDLILRTKRMHLGFVPRETPKAALASRIRAKAFRFLMFTAAPSSGLVLYRESVRGATFRHISAAQLQALSSELSACISEKTTRCATTTSEDCPTRTPFALRGD
jgi:hypothetical protein